MPEIQYSDGSTVSILGKPRRLKIKNIQGISPRRAYFSLTNNVLEISFDKEKLQIEESTFLRKRLINFFKSYAQDYFEKKTLRYADLIGRQPSKVEVRYYKSRWASTYSNDKIRYNYRLLMAPIPVINYVIVHELAHLIHFNHSPKFWDLVETFIPDRKAQEQYLKENALFMQI